MHQEIIFSGFGGQGALLLGNCWLMPRWIRACK